MRRWAWALLLASVLAVLVGSLGLLLWQRKRHQDVGRALLERQQELGRALSKQFWRRPVLRGAPAPGNAALVAHDRVLRVELPSGVELEAALAGRLEPGSEVALTLGRYAPELENFRAATRHAQSLLFDATLLDPGAVGSIDNLAHYRSVLLLLLNGQRQAGPECLAVAADAARLAQDWLPGGDVVRALVVVREIEAAVKVLHHCAARVPCRELRTAAREFAVLARHWPSITRVAGAGALLDAQGVQAEYVLAPWGVAWLGPKSAAPGDLAAAWRFYLDEAALLLPERRPAPAERRVLVEHLERRATHSSAVIQQALSNQWSRQLLDRLWQARARLGATAAALGELAGTAARALVDDPYASAEISVLRKSTTSVEAWSVGPNGSSDGGSGDDVVVGLGCRAEPGRETTE